VTVIDPTSTLGALVTDHPHIARTLERRHLDYCCGGNHTLAEACAESGNDVDEVVAELSALEPFTNPSRWAAMGAAELVDHLESTHHRYLWDEMPRLTELGAKVVSVHGARHNELAAIADTFAALRADLEPHLLKEERILFPIIRQLDADVASGTSSEFHCGSVRNPISVMLAEHDAAGDLLARLRDLTDGYRLPDDACASYAAWFRGLEELEHDTHQHIHKENNRLFPMVVELESHRGAAR
jgi:regulator of cell morphogenesis and NO signaling